MKCQILFSRKNQKNITNLSSAESAHSVVSVLENFLILLQKSSKDLTSNLKKMKYHQILLPGLGQKRGPLKFFFFFFHIFCNVFNGK